LRVGATGESAAKMALRNSIAGAFLPEVHAGFERFDRWSGR
jgi:hypothetical protein